MGGREPGLALAFERIVHQCAPVCFGGVRRRDGIVVHLGDSDSLLHVLNGLMAWRKGFGARTLKTQCPI